MITRWTRTMQGALLAMVLVLCGAVSVASAQQVTPQAQPLPPPGGPVQPPAAPSSAIAPTKPPVDPTDVQDEIHHAGQVGDALLTNKPQFSISDGGEKGLGVAHLAGQDIDVNRLIPNSQDPSYIKRLKKANNGHDLLGLKKLYDEDKAHETGHPDVTNVASTVVHNSAASKLYTRKSVEHDSSMTSSRMVINQSKGGNIMGDVFADCSTKTVTDPTTSTGTIHEDKTCNKVLIPGAGGPACTRTRTGTAHYTTLDGSKEAPLTVTQGTTHHLCTRKTTVTKKPNTLHQAKNATLDITEETGGLSCTRDITANIHATHESGSASGNLPINTEMGGNSCKRTVKVTVSDPPKLGKWKMTVSNTQRGSCRTRTIVLHPPSGTQTIYIDGPYDSGMGDMSADPLQVKSLPTKANGWKLVLIPLGCRVMISPKDLPSAHFAKVEHGNQNKAYLADMRFHGWLGYFYATYYGKPKHSVHVSDSGNCGDKGTSSCPTKWSCSKRAPTGNVTTSDARKVSPLYPGAPSTCAKGSLDRQCSGSPSRTSTISIASKLPPGVAAVTPNVSSPLGDLLPTAYAAEAPGVTFSNFTWKVTNPQKGVKVTLVHAPSASNGWKAEFKVTRTDFSYRPKEPHVVMSWTVTTKTVVYGKGDDGNCSDPGSAACPTQWKCVTNAPTTIDGYPVSKAEAKKFYPLFPGASTSCTKGQLNRVCNGNSTLGTTVAIGNLLPAGAKTISNFKWKWTNPDPNLTVTLVSPPTYNNGWTATFKVNRQYEPGEASPPKPKVHLTWDVAGPPIIVIGVSDDGDCDANPDSKYCKLAWTCKTSAPQTIDGVKVTAPNPSPLYPGAKPSDCLSASLDQTCGGTGAKRTSVSIADKIYKDDKKITNFQWKVTTPVSGVKVSLIQTPSYKNHWVAIFETTRTGWSDMPEGQPVITMTWKMRGPPVFAFKIVDNGDCSATSNQFCDVAWSCDQSAPVKIDGITVPPAVVKKEPHLFPNDGGACMKATLNYDCKKSWNGEGGHFCWTDQKGKKECVDIPPSDTPPNTCKDLEANKSCILVKSDCAIGAMDANGFCHVRTYDYDCITEVQVPDGSSHDVTTCTSAQPCLDGTCTPPKKNTNPPSSRNASLAKQVMVQTITSDWTWSGAKKVPDAMVNQAHQNAANAQKQNP